MTTASILVVEDDAAIARPLLAALRSADYSVEHAATGGEAMSRALERRPDLVLLDLGLPDADGVDVCRSLRAVVPDTVVVVLTARHDEADVLVALDSGADDYLTKPFRIAELLARIRAHLRRVVPAEDEATLLTGGPVSINVAERRVRVRDREVDLRPKEFDLLVELLRHAGEAVRREDLMANVWDENWFGSTKTLDMHVSALRRRLAEAGAPDGLITTLRGFGYRWEGASGGDPVSSSASRR